MLLGSFITHPQAISKKEGGKISLIGSTMRKISSRRKFLCNSKSFLRAMLPAKWSSVPTQDNLPVERTLKQRGRHGWRLPALIKCGAYIVALPQGVGWDWEIINSDPL